MSGHSKPLTVGLKPRTLTIWGERSEAGGRPKVEMQSWQTSQVLRVEMWFAAFRTTSGFAEVAEGLTEEGDVEEAGEVLGRRSTRATNGLGEYAELLSVDSSL